MYQLNSILRDVELTWFMCRGKSSSNGVTREGPEKYGAKCWLTLEGSAVDYDMLGVILINIYLYKLIHVSDEQIHQSSYFSLYHSSTH